MLKKQDKEYEKGSIIFEPLSKISADFEGKKKIVPFFYSFVKGSIFELFLL